MNGIKLYSPSPSAFMFTALGHSYFEARILACLFSLLSISSLYKYTTVFPSPCGNTPFFEIEKGNVAADILSVISGHIHK